MEIGVKEKKIIEILIQEDELATTKISFLISSNLYQTEFYLNNLLNLNIITKEERNNATYWKLKGESVKNGI